MSNIEAFPKKIKNIVKQGAKIGIVGASLLVGANSLEAQQSTELSLEKTETNRSEKEINLDKIDKQKLFLLNHINSQDFFNRAVEELGSTEQASNFIKELENNIKTVVISFLSKEEIIHDTESGNAVYYPVIHQINYPNTDLMDETIIHELIHAAYHGRDNISQKAGDLLFHSFQSDSKENNEMNTYLNSLAERQVRKILLDIELEKQGIKNYGEKFTPEHYQKLKELDEQGKLGRGAGQFFRMTNKTDLEKIMNEVADNLQKNDNTYRYQGWDYGNGKNRA